MAKGQSILDRLRRLLYGQHVSLAAEFSADKGEINSAEATLRDQLSYIHSELGERAERLENASAERDGTMQKVTVELGRIASRLDVLGTLVGDTSARLSDTDTVLAEKLAVLARDDSNA
ncbi:MAG: hypothetical protein ABGY42_01330 [bacterium]